MRSYKWIHKTQGDTIRVFVLNCRCTGVTVRCAQSWEEYVALQPRLNCLIYTPIQKARRRPAVTHYYSVIYYCSHQQVVSGIAVPKISEYATTSNAVFLSSVGRSYSEVHMWQVMSASSQKAGGWRGGKVCLIESISVEDAKELGLDLLQERQSASKHTKKTQHVKYWSIWHGSAATGHLLKKKKQKKTHRRWKWGALLPVKQQK